MQVIHAHWGNKLLEFPSSKYQGCSVQLNDSLNHDGPLSWRVLEEEKEEEEEEKKKKEDEVQIDL